MCSSVAGSPFFLHVLPLVTLDLDAKRWGQWWLLLGLVAFAAPKLLAHLVHSAEIRVIYQLQKILVPELAMERLGGLLFPREGESVSLLSLDHIKLQLQQTLGKAMFCGMAMVEASIFALHTAQKDSSLHLNDPIIQQNLEVNTEIDLSMELESKRWMRE